MSVSRHARILRVVLATTLQAIPTLIGILVLNFVLLQLAPGDAADAMAAENGGADPETMASFRALFGLDLPLVDQIALYFSNLGHLSLGVSPRLGIPVVDLILSRLPNTLLLVGLATAFALAIGIAIGTAMAICVGRAPDKLLSTLVLVFYSTPNFWMGLMLILIFSVLFGWLPSGGTGSIGAQLTLAGMVIDKLRYLVLPVLSLALFQVAIYARVMRASMLEVLSLDFVRTARSKGLTATRVIVRHVLRNALLPVTTLAGIQIGGLFGGAVVIETIYSWPGLGRLTYDSVIGRDFIVLLGILLFSGLFVIVCNLIVDLVQAILDPRITI